MNPIQCLFQREGLPRIDLPKKLAALYGGDFGMPFSVGSR